MAGAGGGGALLEFHALRARVGAVVARGAPAAAPGAPAPRTAGRLRAVARLALDAATVAALGSAAGHLATPEGRLEASWSWAGGRLRAALRAPVNLGAPLEVHLPLALCGAALGGQPGGVCRVRVGLGGGEGGGEGRQWWWGAALRGGGGGGGALALAPEAAQGAGAALQWRWAQAGEARDRLPVAGAAASHLVLLLPPAAEAYSVTLGAE